MGGPTEQTSSSRSSWTGYNVTCHSADAWPRFEAQLSTLATPVLCQAQFVLLIPESAHRLQVHQDSDSQRNPGDPGASTKLMSHRIPAL